MFLHDNRTFSITITHDGTDPRMRRLRHTAVYEAAVRAIPMLADWIVPERAEPVTPVLAGGQLYNGYRGNSTRSADRCCRTDLGRRRRVHHHAAGGPRCGAGLRAGTGPGVLPDRQPDRRRSGHRDIRRLVPDLHPPVVRGPCALRRRSDAAVGGRGRRPVEAAAVGSRGRRGGRRPALRAAVEPYDRMAALPSSLHGLQDRARAIYATGWRPPVAEGPTREELGRLCAGDRAEMLAG